MKHAVARPAHQGAVSTVFLRLLYNVQSTFAARCHFQVTIVLAVFCTSKQQCFTPAN
ncbi:hypothetical protein H7F15_10920 [Pontibacter sp. Tf4]|uniref:hypothetical protein n=1 Tax=Pontibacter sp. Tf4 TaxID=2761620 RepID=UPI00162A4759|nr:hypothetical protein [Pontibacter sp. Tf4]MBB6611549.1 hypothetical protein [Pontibacter sp. Tf4]